MHARITLSACVCLGLLTFSATGQERLDFWAEAPTLFGSAPAGSDIRADAGGREFTLDYRDKKAGDFSVRFNADKVPDHTIVGFTPGPYRNSWPLGQNFSLRLWLKATGPRQPKNWPLVLIDNHGRRAETKLTHFAGDGNWQEINLPLARLTAQVDFDFTRVNACQLEVGPDRDGEIWFDYVRFTNPDGPAEIGVTDKTVPQRITEAQASRSQRVKEAFDNVGASKGLRDAMQLPFVKLWRGEDLDETNAELLNVFSTKDEDIRVKYRLADHWCLVVNQYMYQMYYLLGSKSKDPLRRGRLYPETERALLEELWDRTVQKNDIHWARMSTWWLTGSENHDMVAKVSNLISAQIFMNEPEYAARIYPDLGRGPGSGYWFHQMYAFTTDLGPEGRAHHKDGKQYNAADHYQAWAKFFNEYFAERARKGFFLETNASGYMGVTISHINDIYDYCEDRPLRERTRKFMDLIWAEWAQDALSGVRAGSKTRAGARRAEDAMYRMARFLLGGPGRAGGNFISQLVSDYQLPEIIWRLALDRQGLGSYAYVSRKPGEEENTWPRPLGMERTLLCDTDSRFVRYSWVTPDYILGTQMDHPAAIHSHLSIAARIHGGIIFPGREHARVFVCPLEISAPDKFKSLDKGIYRTAQHQNVQITQQMRRYFQVNPEWYPGPPGTNDLPFGVYFGSNLDQLTEKAGWIFVQHGNAYLAVRVVLGEKQLEGSYEFLKDKSTEGLYAQILPDAYDWNEEHTIIKLKDDYLPIIFEAARKDDYPTFEAFQADILDNPLKLVKTVVVGWYILTYKGCGPDAPEIYFNAANAEIPQIAGKYVDYSYPMTFDSPYLQSAYNSGIVTIKKGSDKLVLDFND